MVNNYVLNIAKIHTRVLSLGPGIRFAIWVQGCPFNCRNCISQEWIPFSISNIIKADALVQYIAGHKDIEGITISGGEPFMQSHALSYVLRNVRSLMPSINIIVFTGFKIELLKGEGAKRLLEVTDVLIDGLFSDELFINKGLRGSSNQRIHFLSERMRSFENYFYDSTRLMELHVTEKELFSIGLPNSLTFKNSFDLWDIL